MKLVKKLFNGKVFLCLLLASSLCFFSCDDGSSKKDDDDDETEDDSEGGQKSVDVSCVDADYSIDGITFIV